MFPPNKKHFHLEKKKETKRTQNTEKENWKNIYGQLYPSTFMLLFLLVKSDGLDTLDIFSPFAACLCTHSAGLKLGQRL